MKKKWISFLLAVAITLAANPAHAHAALTPTGEHAQHAIQTASSWAVEPINEAISKRLFLPDYSLDYQSSITRMDFCTIAVRWLEYAMGETIDVILYEKGLSIDETAFDDFAYLPIVNESKYVYAAYALGITNGIGENLFGPLNTIDRQQAATFVQRTLKVAGASMSAASQADFTDMAQAASWAAESINYVRAHTIMNGTSTNPPRFSPTLTYTYEQALATFARIDRDALLPYPAKQVPTVYGIALGDSKAQVEKKMGTPNRVFPCTSGTMYVYHSEDYTTFVTASFADATGKVTSLYTTGFKGFDRNDMIGQRVLVTTYADVYDNGRVYASSFSDPYAFYTAGVTEEEAQTAHIFALTNAFRALHSAAPLTWNEALETAAQNHAEDMRANNYFDHISPSGSTSLSRALAAGYPQESTTMLLGENINMEYASAEEVLNSWVNSSGHRTNMLIPYYEELGVGHKDIFYVQVFGTRQ